MMPWTVSGTLAHRRRRARRACARTAPRRAGCPRRGEAAPPAAPPEARCGRAAPTSSCAVSSSESGESEIVERVALAAAPARTTIEELGPGRATHSSGTSSAQSTRWSTKSSRSVVGPMEVLEHEHGRALSASSSKKRRQASKLSWRGRRSAPRPSEADERTQLRLDPVGVRRSERRARPRRAASAPARAPSSVSRIPAWALTISPSAQKRHAFAVRKRATLAPVDRARGLFELVWNSSATRRLLPIPGTPTSVNELRRTLAPHALERGREERRARARGRQAASVAPRTSTPSRALASSGFQTDDRLALPLRLDRDRSRRYSIACSVARYVVSSDEDPVAGSGGLQASRSVDDVARGHALARLWPGVQRHERLAGRDPDPHLELAFLVRPVADRERRAHGALRIVLVRERRAEERHDRVADELLDRASEALQLRAQPLVVRPQDRLDVLGIERLGARGEADEVGEEHRHDLALAARAHCTRSTG